MLIDMLFAHNEDLGEPVEQIYGINVYNNPRLLTLIREHKHCRDYIKFSKLQPEYGTDVMPSDILIAREPEEEIELIPGVSYTCWDKSVASLDLADKDKRESSHQRWNLYKNNGMTYWSFTSQEMQRVIRLEKAEVSNR